MYKLFAASSYGISLDVVHFYIQTNIDVVFSHHIRQRFQVCMRYSGFPQSVNSALIPAKISSNCATRAAGTVHAPGSGEADMN